MNKYTKTDDDVLTGLCWAIRDRAVQRMMKASIRLNNPSTCRPLEIVSVLENIASFLSFSAEAISFQYRKAMQVDSQIQALSSHQAADAGHLSSIAREREAPVSQTAIRIQP